MQENFDKLRIEVDGNNSMTYVDDILVDAVEQKEFWGTKIVGKNFEAPAEIMMC